MHEQGRLRALAYCAMLRRPGRSLEGTKSCTHTEIAACWWE